MTSSTINANNVAIHFQNEVNREYVRGGIFSPFKGTSPNDIIQMKQDEKKVSIPLVAKLKGTGVSGSGTLAGNEEALSNYAFTLQPTYYRNGVLIDNEENEKSEFELFKEAKPALMNWAMELQRDQIIQAFGAVEASGTYLNYGSASAANLDTWQAANKDRILYGSALANTTSGNHTTSLGTIDTTNDKLDSGIVTLLKRMAANANPLIKPYMVKGDQPHYVFFVDSYGFRDLEADSAILAAQQYAMERGKDNPLFQAGDILWRGVVIKEVPDITKFIDGDSSGSPFDGVWGANATSGDGLDNGGDTASRIGVGFFCGAQAIGMGMGKMPAFKRRKEDDYEHQNGVGISMKHDIKKMFYNGKQHGVITCFYSAAKDA
jgi:N4-gp56 family major capsid protein